MIGGSHGFTRKGRGQSLSTIVFSSDNLRRSKSYIGAHWMTQDRASHGWDSLSEAYLATLAAMNERLESEFPDLALRLEMVDAPLARKLGRTFHPQDAERQVEWDWEALFHKRVKREKSAWMFAVSAVGAYGVLSAMERSGSMATASASTTLSASWMSLRSRGSWQKSLFNMRNPWPPILSWKRSASAIQILHCSIFTSRTLA